MANSTKFTILLVVCVLVSGCAGVGPGLEDAAEEAEEQANEDGGDSSDDQQAASSDDWCPEGQSTQYANPDTGQQVSLEFEGIVERDGREVCHYVWETDDPDGEIARMEMYVNEDETYRETIYYDAEGEVVFEQVQTPDE